MIGLFFEKIGFENNLIFLYILKAEFSKFFEQVVIHKVCHIKRAFPTQFLNGSRINMTDDQV